MGFDLRKFARVPQQDAKALQPHPALMSPDPITVRGGRDGRRVGFSQREAPRHLQAYGGRQDAIDWVMDCVRLIAETASDAEWYFEQKGERLLNHEGPQSPYGMKAAPMMAVKLFEDPNPYMGWSEHIELTIIDFLLVGNAYWMKWGMNEAGQPLALYRMSPAHIKVVPGPLGIEGYEWHIPDVMEEAIELPPEAVVHFRQANPHSPYYGMGIIQGGSRPLDLELALTNTQATYFEKGAHPSVVLQSDRRVPDVVLKKVAATFRALYGGSNNAGEPLVLQAGLKAEKMSPDAHQAMFEALTKLSRDRILAMFRVPPPMLGIMEGTGDTKLNEAQRIFDSKTMRPLLDKLQWAITRGVTSAWDLDFVIDHKYVMPIEERVKLMSTFAQVPGVKLREIREFGGLQPLGDERDEWVLNLPGEDGTEEDHDGGLPDRNLAGEPGRPPNPENTRRFPDGAEVSTGAKARGTVQRAPGEPVEHKSILKPPEPKPALTPEEIARRLEAKAIVLEQRERNDLERRIIPPDDVLRDDRTTEIDSIVADLTRELADAAYPLERALLDHAEGKAEGTVYQRIKKSAAWSTFSDTVSAALDRALRRAASVSAQHEGRQGRVPTDEIDYDAIIDSIMGRPEGSEAIVKNLKDEIAQKVLQIQRKGGSRDDVERAIRESVDFWRQTKAETVALTEATHAYNEVTLTVAELTGHSEVHVFDGDDNDEPCQEANGQRWTIGFAREHRLEHPRCRRAFAPA